MSKKALLVGINYEGTESQLNGCINDVDNVKKFLLSRGYEEENITVLTDHTSVKPTRNNILKELCNLILSDARTLYMHYSGHGSYIRDTNYDELDGYDECLVPIDYNSVNGGMIVDDQLRNVLSLLKKQQTLNCVLDCCHSGSGMDLTYNLYKRYGSGKLDMLKESHRQDTDGVCIMLSGCRDDQTSADAYLNGEYQGALTNAYLNSVDVSETYEDLVTNVKRILKMKQFKQQPMLSSGRYLDLSSKLSI